LAQRVSIIIPTYNRIQTLRKVIDSYLAQACLHELIFVIDGSDDGTREYLEGLARLNPVIRIASHGRNLGVSVSRNDGIELATGDCILFGEDDLRLGKDYTSTLLACMERSGADIIGGRIVYNRVGETDEETLQRCNGYDRPLINYWIMSGYYAKRLPGDVEMPFLHAIALVKADVCKRIRFDPAFFAREETDFYLRAVTAGYRVVFCPHTTCIHLPRDTGRGGGWRVGVLNYQLLATKNNNMLVDRHYKVLKNWGMKGNRATFKLLHLINRIRIVYLYFRYSTQH